MGTLTESLVESLRTQFPGLARRHGDRLAVFLDGPAGTQVPQRVIHAMTRYFSECNANHGGCFPTSQESDRWLGEAFAAFAQFLGASDPGEVIFGQNMTSLTFALSRALAKTWRAGDEVIVTRLDHDANVTPWVRAAEDAGVTIRYVSVRREDCTLDLEDFYAHLNDRTRLVAVGGASNSVGTINPLREMVQAAHQHQALVFVDAVHLAPHRRLSVEQWGCDFLACSVYKYFGPHTGVLWGRRQHLEALPAYKVRPAAETLPDRWMTGTQSHESIVGSLAAIDYLAEVGRRVADDEHLERSAAWDVAFESIRDYERRLTVQFLEGIASLEAYQVYGITDPGRLEERVSTFSIRHRSKPAAQVASELAREGIYAWHGHYYALLLSEFLGVEPEGMVRLGLLHYNLPSEVERTLEVLQDLS